ncbi:glycosyltransferase family 2 protein [Bradyrhizobium sp. INPA01-394B]|uniref:Glycosyltransferase family 2 protein n=1 Tax=Bradyrhizobium campsiandrae TaxID=1729892 RepID=A0ABR7U9J0_9BRAD|nr:glycosyltransferase family 2 protein [Bradyrhizobium campsiandrae]MBC9879335.1 glycosyltransferase family 2 protein [Bradyrhizobium campsiandrae]MBC9980735.1 glycosyltransferase family 2 protein [Bradyrhizobium campsiandrae]
MSLAVVILTFNEERHIGRALSSVADFASELFVIDSFSTDRTVEIAKAHGAVVIQHPFINYAKQFQWALDNAPIAADWIMRLDADEVIEPDLAERLRTDLPALPKHVVGINLKRKHIFLGRWIRHGGRYPLVLLRIWRRGHGRIEDRWMDEHMILSGGQTVTIEGGFADHNLKDLTFFTDKHNKYATREAIDVINQRRGLFRRDVDLVAEEGSRQAALTRWIKEKLYNRIPYQISTPAYLFYRMVFRLGFLDGKEGILYHCLQGFWYRLLVGAKIDELERALEGIEDPAAMRAEIQRRTGFALDV